MIAMETARDYIREVVRNKEDFTRSWVAEGILWADESCRITGTLSLAIRNADVEGGKRLLNHLLESGVSSQAEVPRFLNQYFNTCMLKLKG